MNSAHDRSRRLAFVTVILVALITALGSESVEDDDDPPEPPVTTTFVIGSLAAPFEVDRGDLDTVVTDLRLAGDYLAAAGDRLTLDREFVTLDTTCEFDVAMTPSDPDDARSGLLSFTIDEDWDFAPDRNPTAGRFTTLFEGTTTIVRVASNPSGAGITVGGAAETNIGWGDFRGAVDDQGDAIDVRVASVAYRMVGDIYAAALLAEAAERDIDARRDDLEGAGVGEPVQVDCVANAGADAGQRALTWKSDAPGTGEGSVGNGDGFEVQYANCRPSSGAQTLRGDIGLKSYQLVTSEPKSFDVDVELTALYRSNASIGAFPQPGIDLPRSKGELSLRYQQEAASTPTALQD